MHLKASDAMTHTHTPSCQAKLGGGGHTNKDIQISGNLAQSLSLRLASVCSQVCLLCSTPGWPGFSLLFTSEWDTLREERSFFSSGAPFERGTGFIVLANLLNHFSGGGSLWVQGKVRGHVDSQAISVSWTKPLGKFTNIYSCHSPTTATDCKVLFFVFFMSWSRVSGGNISFEFARVALPTHVEEARALIPHSASCF